MKITLSLEQIAAIKAAEQQNKNLIIEAVAGAGKTFTLIEILKILRGSVAFTVFNKDNAIEIKNKISNYNLPNVNVGTVHSFGFGAIRRAYKNIKVDGNKLNNLAKEEFNGDYINLRQIAIRGADLAKQVMPETSADWRNMFDHYNIWDDLPNNVKEDIAIDAAKHLLNVSNSIKNVIDFSDMVYMANDLKIWQYDVVLLDEAQDTNKARRELIKKLVKPNGILIAVGDPHQAIYGFTGADHNSLTIIKNEFNATTLRLSTTYRCPKSIVNYAKQWVNHIQADKSAPEGILNHIEINQMEVKPNDVIICRNTKPLIELAYTLIRQNISCKVEGRNIGKGLIKLINKWKTVKNIGHLEIKLKEWAKKEIEKHTHNENFNLCQEIEDKYTSILVFMEQCNVDDGLHVLTGKIRELFEDNIENCIILTTIHKSKGREWEHVFALGMNKYNPSKWAKKEWEIEQEKNLCYVQCTRSKKHLTIVNV